MFARIKRIAPRRGWRAFIGEVGIIVLGVLVAVGIGKLVEAVDWRDKVAGARKSLDLDVRVGHFGFYERRLVTPCLRRQLDRLERALLTGSGSEHTRVRMQPSPILSGVYVHPARLWSALEWTSVVADNIPSHMPTRDRDFYRSYYQALVVMDGLNAEELRDTSDLDLMSRPIVLDGRTRGELLRTIMRERRRLDLMNGIADYALAKIRASGRRYQLTRQDWADMNTARWCRANRLL